MRVVVNLKSEFAYPGPAYSGIGTGCSDASKTFAGLSDLGHSEHADICGCTSTVLFVQGPDGLLVMGVQCKETGTAKHDPKSMQSLSYIKSKVLPFSVYRNHCWWVCTQRSKHRAGRGKCERQLAV